MYHSGGGADNGETVHMSGQGVYGISLHLLLNFAVNLKLATYVSLSTCNIHLYMAKFFLGLFRIQNLLYILS